MVAAQEQYTSNRALQIALYDAQDEYRDILTDWKVIERLYKKYTDILEDITIIDTKIAEKDNESDKTKKTSLESKKAQLTIDLEQRITLLQEKDETMTDLTIETLTSEMILA